MAARKINFTKAALEALQCEAGIDRVYVYDLRTPSLAFCVTSKSSRSFYVYKRVKGRPQRIRLGGFPELSIEQVRGLAAELNGEIARGADPQQAKRIGRAEATVGELLSHFIDGAKLHKRTWADDEKNFKRYIEDWRSRKVSSITQSDVQARHTKIGRDNGKYSANRVLALISAMWGVARGVGYIGENPAKGIKKFKEESRERFLQGTELPNFFRALAEEPNTTIRDYIIISLMTGARRSNVQAMAWTQIDLDAATWTIPGSSTKNGRDLTVALSDRALAVLTDRKAANANASEPSPWVFPGRGKTGHLMEPKTTWAAILKRAGITNLRLHDLRRTLGSWMAAAGASLPIIGRTLGHKNQSTTAIYARLNLDPVRSSVSTATAAITAASVPKKLLSTVVKSEPQLSGSDCMY